MRVAITGSSGYLGTAVARRLAAAGHDILPVRRGAPAAPAALWDPATGWVRAGALESVDAVVHLTGVSVGARRWTPARRVLLRASRVDATRVLADHLRTLARPPRVLVSASATGYYGEGGEAVLTEQAARGEGFLAELVADWEQAAAAAGALGVRVVQARFGPVIAPDSELIRRLRLPFTLGLGGRLGSGQQWFPWVCTVDAARAVEFLLQEPLAGAVNVVAPQAIRNREFTAALARALRRPAVLPVPAFALRTLFGAPLTAEALLVSQRVTPARLLAVGFRFEHSTIAEALRSVGS